MLQETVTLARVGPEARQRLVDVAVQYQRASHRGSEQRGRLLEEQRQVVLDAAVAMPAPRSL